MKNIYIYNKDLLNIYGRLFGFLLGCIQLLIGFLWTSFSIQQLLSGSNKGELRYLEVSLIQEFITSQVHGVFFIGLWMGMAFFFIGIISLLSILFFKSKEASIIFFTVSLMYFLIFFIKSFFIPSEVYFGEKIFITNLTNILWGFIGLIAGFLLLKSHLKEFKAFYVTDE